MRIHRQWPFVVYLGSVPWYHLTQVTDCECDPAVGLERQPRADPIQPEQWASAVSAHLERASIETSAPGTTVRPGTGEAYWTGYAPEVLSEALARAVEVVESLCSDRSSSQC